MCEQDLIKNTGKFVLPIYRNDAVWTQNEDYRYEHVRVQNALT